MVKDLEMGNTFYDEIKKRKVADEPKTFEDFVQSFTVKRIFFILLKLVIIPAIIAGVISIFIGGGFLTIFVLIVIAIVSVMIISFLKARSDLRI